MDAGPDTRRKFLKRAVKAGFAFLSILFGAAFMRFLSPSGTGVRETRYYPVLNEEDLPKQGVKRIELTYQKDRREMTFRAFLVNDKEEVFAVSSVCSHLGCLVDWSRSKGQFICPCHGGKYAMNGAVAAGPPPHPLARLPLKVQDGKVYLGLKV